jgi:hypothetical protein
VHREFNVLALLKGNEQYVYIYDDDSRDALIDAFRDHAACPDLSLSWFDATVLTQKAREQAEASATEHAHSRLPT